MSGGCGSGSAVKPPPPRTEEEAEALRGLREEDSAALQGRVDGFAGRVKALREAYDSDVASLQAQYRNLTDAKKAATEEARRAAGQAAGQPLGVLLLLPQRCGGRLGWVEAGDHQGGQQHRERGERDGDLRGAQPLRRGLRLVCVQSQAACVGCCGCWLQRDVQLQASYVCVGVAAR